MKNKVLESLWNNKVFKVVILVSLLTAVGLPAWLEASDYPGHEGFVYKMLFFMLLGGLWALAFLYFIGELKKINNIIWKPVAVSVLAIQLFLIYRYNGLLSISEDGTLNLFSEDGTLSLLNLFKQPIIWMLVGTTIGYFIVRIYNRNKLQSTK